jgi:methanogenic corrinoid protein MtbC1
MAEMNLTEDESKLFDAILELDEDAVLTCVQQLVDAGEEPIQIAEVARQAMEKVGVLFQTKKLFLTELIMAGELLSSIMNRLGFAPGENANVQDSKGVVLLGTVAGDIHDIGKNIVGSILASNGFTVVDIGVDVPPAKFVEKVEEHQPGIVGLCGLLTVAFDSMKATVAALQDAGLRDNVKIIIGGGAVDQSVCDYVGADGWGATASDAVKLCQEYLA